VVKANKEWIPEGFFQTIKRIVEVYDVERADRFVQPARTMEIQNIRY
jgi:hypothetical protein